jgi:hypothetical protein
MSHGIEAVLDRPTWDGWIKVRSSPSPQPRPRLRLLRQPAADLVIVDDYDEIQVTDHHVEVL